MRSWLIDLEPLYIYPDYRRLWIASSLSAVGNHLTVFAITFQIYIITNSSLAVGSIGLFCGVPAIVLALWGGTLGDRFDRRKIVFIATLLQSLGCALLLLYTLLGGSNVFCFYFLMGWIFLLGAINVPAGAAILPSLVAGKHLQSAATLRMFSMHSAMILGPLLGGLIAPKYGIATLYFIDFFTFCGALYGILRLPTVGHQRSIYVKNWEAVKVGFQFVKKTPIILGALYVDFALAFFGIPNALFPAINASNFGGHADQLGMMFGFPAIGGLVAMMLSGYLKHLTAPVVTMVKMCILWALCVIGLAASSSFVLSLMLLFFMGALDSVVAAVRCAIIQKLTPDEYRARVSAVEYVVDNASTQLGNVRAGLLAMAVAPSLAVMIGGFSTLTLALLTFSLLPACGRLRSTFH